ARRRRRARREEEVVRMIRREGPVAWVTLNRPEAANALSGELLAALEAAAEELAADRSVRMVVVTGAGDKAFSAGADLKERRGMTDAETRARLDLINRCFNRVARLPQLTVAAINGVAFGGGLALALACHLRVARATARPGLAEVRRGILPGAGGTQRLPRLVGPAVAKEMILLGRRLTAAQAKAVGLVHDVADDLRAAVQALAAELEGSAPIS